MSSLHEHIDTVGPALTKTSVGIGGTTSLLGFNGWVEQNAVVIGVFLTLIFGVIGVLIQYKNYRLNKRRIEAMERKNSMAIKQGHS